MSGNSLREVLLRRHWPIFLCLLAVWILLYLPHLRTNPAWYGDETLTLMIGKSLYAGIGADRSLQATFWHPSYSYQPGYAWLAGWAASLSGGEIVGARFLNALLAFMISLAIFFLGQRSFGRLPALLAALIFLTYGQTVIHFRWIYPHNAVALGFTLTVLFLLRKSSWKSDWGAGAGLAIAAVSHPLFAHGAIAAWLCRVKRPISWVRMAMLPALAVVACLGWTLARQYPHLWALEDMGTLAKFYQNFSSDNGEGLQVFQNIWVFYSHDFFHIGSAIAAIVCCRRRFYAIAVFLVIVSGLLLQNRQNLPVFYYQAVVFLPVMAMAWAGALRTVQIELRQRLGTESWTRWFPAAFFAIPIVFFSQNVGPATSGTLVPRNHPWVTQNIGEVEAAAAWLNEHTEPQDLVICHQNIGWLLKSRTADLMQATAWTGRSTFTFETTPERTRFRYPADLHAARFLVIGDIDQRWTLGQPNVSWIVEEISRVGWRIVWRGENYIIVENPNLEVGKL